MLSMLRSDRSVTIGLLLPRHCTVTRPAVSKSRIRLARSLDGRSGTADSVGPSRRRCLRAQDKSPVGFVLPDLALHGGADTGGDWAGPSRGRRRPRNKSAGLAEPAALIELGHAPVFGVGRRTEEVYCPSLVLTSGGSAPELPRSFPLWIGRLGRAHRLGPAQTENWNFNIIGIVRAVIARKCAPAYKTVHCNMPF
jgi:hypothetical protein